MLDITKSNSLDSGNQKELEMSDVIFNFLQANFFFFVQPFAESQITKEISYLFQLLPPNRCHFSSLPKGIIFF